MTDIYSPASYGTNNDVYSVLLGNDVVSCTGCVDEQFYNRQSHPPAKPPFLLYSRNAPY